MELTAEDTRSLPEVVVHTVILALTTISALAGNSLVCLAFYRNRRLRTITNYYVLSLAVADIMIAIFYFPFGAVSSGLRRWPFNYNFCQFTGSLGVSLAQISTFTLAFASINRYFCVVKPQRYSTLFTRKKTIFSIVAAWVSSFLITMLFFAANSIYKWSPNALNCQLTNPDKLMMRIAYLFFACLFLVPMSLTVFCYSRVYHVIRQHNNDIVPSLQGGANTQGRSAQEIKTSRVLFAAVLGFGVSWAPIIFMMILRFGFQVSISPSAQTVISLFISFSAWINPIIYGAMNRAMRKEFLKILLCRND